MSTNVLEKKTSYEQAADEPVRWLRFLSRWALVTALMVIALLLIFGGGLGFAPSDNALGLEYRELLQAVRVPAMYRLFTTFDAMGWLMMGGVLLIVSAILKNRAPIRARLIAACGIGLLTGILGGVTRLVAISDLAARYAIATPPQQAVLLQATLTLFEIIAVFFVVGDILAGAGYLLVASVGFSPGAFPRWLAGWFVLAGALALLQGITSALGAFSFPVLLLTLVVGVLGLHVAVAVAFWRPPPTLVSAAAGY